MESREILEQKYQALPPEIKYIVELLAYSCCPKVHWNDSNYLSKNPNQNAKQSSSR